MLNSGKTVLDAEATGLISNYPYSQGRAKARETASILTMRLESDTPQARIGNAILGPRHRLA